MGSGQIVPSPSDSALNKRSQDATEPAELQEDDRGALSEVISVPLFCVVFVKSFPQGESAPPSATNRRRFFGRSTESSSTVKDEAASNNDSSAALSTSSALVTPSPRSPKREPLDDSSVTSRHSGKQGRSKRGTDGVTKGTERYSLFSGTFTAPLGKARKPPPRFTPYVMCFCIVYLVPHIGIGQ
jgi:hypothetical protein